MAAFNASARSLDAGIGAVLDELEALGLADDTLVICTTDHGMAFPGAKTTLTDRGIGVFLIMRGPGGFDGRAGDRRAGLADRPLPDDLRPARASRRPHWLQGGSLLPLVHGGATEIRDEVFAEGTYHAAYEPQRAIRTRAGSTSAASTTAHTPVAVNTDDSPSKDLWLRRGWAERAARRPSSSTTSCSIRTRRDNLVGRDRELAAGGAASCAARLDEWMRETGRPAARRAGRRRRRAPSTTSRIRSRRASPRGSPRVIGRSGGVGARRNLQPPPLDGDAPVDPAESHRTAHQRRRPSAIGHGAAAVAQAVRDLIGGGAREGHPEAVGHEAARDGGRATGPGSPAARRRPCRARPSGAARRRAGARRPRSARGRWRRSREVVDVGPDEGRMTRGPMARAVAARAVRPIAAPSAPASTSPTGSRPSARLR